MSLLPSTPDTSAAEEAAPRVIGVDSDGADDLLGALTSETARRLLAELHEEPSPPAALADRIGTSLQNVQYHLANLEEAGAVEVIDTAYSEKGREMDVYAPTDRPLVIFAGPEDDAGGLRAALSRLLGGLGVLAFASLAVQELFGRGVEHLFGGAGTSGGEDRGAAGAPGTEAAGGATAGPAGTDAAGTGDGGGGGVSVAEAPATETGTDAGGATRTAAETAGDAGATATGTVTDVARETAGVADAAAGGLPPGLVFFAGGAAVLVVGFAVWYATR